MAAYATLADIARIYRISPVTARRWAAQDKWRMIESRPARYAITDAQASYDRRRRPERVRAHLERRYAWMLPSTGELCGTGTGTGLAS